MNHSPPAFFFFKVEISSHTFIPLFRLAQVHSGSASKCDELIDDIIFVIQIRGWFSSDFTAPMLMTVYER